MGVSVDEAIKSLLGLVGEEVGVENVRLSESLYRTVASTIEAVDDYPRFDQAAVDGYAISYADLSCSGSLSVLGRTRAGDEPSRLRETAAHRIFTGAPLPTGSDTVVMQEDVEEAAGTLRLRTAVSHGSNVRLQGEDIEPGWRI